MHLSRYVLPFAALIFSACSSAPSISTDAIDAKEAQSWLNRFCSKYDSKNVTELTGDLVMRSNTKEFKGQYPASIAFEKSGKFTMEVTNIIGGTVMQLTGDQTSISTKVPSKPKLDRKGITQYMGLSLPILSQLLRGDLPCPSQKSAPSVEGSRIVIQTETWKWIFDRAAENDGLVPAQVRLVHPSQTVSVVIENWDRDANFARKVSVKSSEGELKWTWRNREVK